ncbi:MAG: hypothetical protein R2939_19725 [Kofleriaceae bacterium]
MLKPNRSFGGTGIVIGPMVDLAEWDDALAAALAPEAAETGGVVAQRYVDVRVKDFPVQDERGDLSLEEFYVVCGFLATPRAGSASSAGRRRSAWSTSARRAASPPSWSWSEPGRPRTQSWMPRAFARSRPGTAAAAASQWSATSSWTALVKPSSMPSRAIDSMSFGSVASR